MKETNLSELLLEEYRIYQLYTLMDRAIPYLQDGLKPVQRRILYTLFRNKAKGLLKVSSATGLVLSLHPHGPASIESAIVNMAQNFTFANNYPLIDKKGYFGERMETMAAASRYIECKLAKVVEFLMFDDMNQVTFVDNYDERVKEPLCLFPKLPIMLINGAEGIGTGYSSMIPSYNHSDVIKAIKSFLTSGRIRKLKPWVRNYTGDIHFDAEKNRYEFSTVFEEIDGDIYITELPKGYDAKKINKHLLKFIEDDYLKDYSEYSAKNEIKIKLIFRRGKQPDLQEVADTIGITTYMSPNMTLISDEGVEIFQTPEEIIRIFAKQRLVVIKKRYELLLKDAEAAINYNNEIIRFIKEKH